MKKTIVSVLLLSCPLVFAQVDMRPLGDRLKTMAENPDFGPGRISVMCQECIRNPDAAYTEDLTKLLDHLLKIGSKPNADPVRQYLVTHAIQALCASGGRAGFDAAVERYEKLPGNSKLQTYFAQSLLSYACKLQIQELLEGEAQEHVAFPEVKDLPAEPGFLSKELREAWLYYKRASAPYDTYQKKVADDAFVYAQANWPLFYKAVQDTVVQPKVETLTCIMPFNWGGGCGTGSDTLYGPKSRAVVLALLKEGRLAESIGAVLQVHYSHMSSALDPENDPEFAWKKQLIEFAGLNWEKLFVGALLGESYYAGNHLSALASYGGEESARLLIAMAPVMRKKEHRMPEYLREVGKMLKRGDAIPKEARQALLAVVTASVKADTPLRDLEAAVKVLSALAETETIPTLKKAALMNNYPVATTAAKALQAMGESATLPPPPQPRRFELILNGKPMKDTTVKYELSGNGQSSLSSQASTDGAGRVTLKGEYFADPKIGADTVRFCTDYLKRLDQLVFHAKLPVAVDPDDVTPVQIRSHRLALRLNNLPNAERFKGQKLVLVLRYLNRLEGESTSNYLFYGQGGTLNLDPADEIVFTQLGEGKYSFTLQAPDRAFYESGEIVMDQDRELDIELKGGGEVRFNLVAPGGDLADTQIRYELKGAAGKDHHKYYDWQTKRYRGLPEGDYQLVVWSSAAKRNQNIARGGHKGATPPACSPFDYEGKEVAFTLSAETPRINLGTIRLAHVEARK